MGWMDWLSREGWTDMGAKRRRMGGRYRGEQDKRWENGVKSEWWRRASEKRKGFPKYFLEKETCPIYKKIPPVPQFHSYSSTHKSILPPPPRPLVEARRRFRLLLMNIHAFLFFSFLFFLSLWTSERRRTRRNFWVTARGHVFPLPLPLPQNMGKKTFFFESSSPSPLPQIYIIRLGKLAATSSLSDKGRKKSFLSWTCFSDNKRHLKEEEEEKTLCVSFLAFCNAKKELSWVPHSFFSFSLCFIDASIQDVPEKNLGVLMNLFLELCQKV